MTDNQTRNRALVRFLLLPTLFLTVGLLGGVRVQSGTRAVLFVPPPLVTLVLAVMLMVLFVRCRLVEVGRWLSAWHAPTVNAAHALTLGALFFASAQGFNSVLPEAGLLRWMFSFFFLWTLWQSQFSSFDARRLVRSLAALFGTAFVIKHLLLASLQATEGGVLRRVAGVLLEGVSLGSLAGEGFAPATGYISFFALALYVVGLVLLPPAPEAEEESARAPRARDLVVAFRQMPPDERASVREAIAAGAPETFETAGESELVRVAGGSRASDDDENSAS